MESNPRKLCLRCGRTKALRYFELVSITQDGYDDVCRTCRKKESPVLELEPELIEETDGDEGWSTVLN